MCWIRYLYTFLLKTSKIILFIIENIRICQLTGQKGEKDKEDKTQMKEWINYQWKTTEI